MPPLIAPPKIKGFFIPMIVCAAMAVFSLAGLTKAAGPKEESPHEVKLPLMFDAQARLSRGDLGNLVRLRILTTIDFPPFNFADQNGRLSGFNVDLAREICAELKIEPKCQIQALAFEDLEKTLEAGGGDAVMAGIAVTADLRRRFAFSKPYIGIPARFARNLSAAIDGDTAAALGGKSVGVVKGTAHEMMLKAFFPALSPQLFETRAAMLDALKAGEVDAVFADGLRLPFWVAGEASAGCCALFDGPYLSEKFLGEGMSVMLRGSDTELAAAFDYALASLSRNGRLQDIYLRYFPNGLY